MTGATRIGRFEILRTLGAGGMGVVYEARDPELNRRVAVKVLRRAGHGDSMRLLREAQALAQLQHPNVVAVHEVGIADGGLFIAMELVDGETLATRQADGPMAWRRAVELYVQAGRGLEAAHAKSIIHRDFKPANVLVDRAGRVRVGDFGLARVEASTTWSEPAADPSAAATPAGGGDDETADAATTVDDVAAPPRDPSDRPATAAVTPVHGGVLASPLTGTGALLGTPRYMAPEQRARKAASARSDQYSYCVGLWEAVYGAHPFPADLDDAAASPPRRVPGRGVPGWLASALETGLARDPARRHPSMTALLDLLERTPRRRRLIALSAAGLAITAGVGTLAVAATRPDAVDPCGHIAPLAAWTPEARDAIRRAFTDSGASFAAVTFDTVARRLDDHATRWRAMRIESCRATRVARTQSEALLDARTLCLDRRAEEVAALVTVLRAADRAVVTRADDAVGALGDLGGCADAAALTRTTPLPSDPARADAIRGLEREVAALSAELDTGLVADRGPRIADVITRARAAAHPPLLVTALALEHKLHIVGDKWPDAARAAQEALLAAEAAGDDEARFGLMASLVEITGFRLGKDEDAARYARDGEALLRRLGDEPMRTARLRCAAALDAWSRGQYADALVEADRCIAERERAVPRDDAQLARAFHLKAIVLEGLNRNDLALAAEERAIALTTAALGDDHPNLARMMNTTAIILHEQGKTDAAAAMLGRVRAIQLAADPGSSSLAATMHTLGHVYRDGHKLEEAAAAYAESIRLAEGRLGPTSNRVADTLDMLGLTLTDLGRVDEGEAAALRSLAIREGNGAGEHPAQAAALRLLGKQYRRRGLYAKALPRYQAALAIAEKKYGNDSPNVVSSLAGVAEVLTDLHRDREARAVLDRALPLTAQPEAAGQRNRVQFTLARALWSTPSERPRARALAEAALAERRADGDDAESLAEIETWLATR